MKQFIKILIFLVFLSGCSSSEIPQKLIPEKADKFAKDYINKLANGDTEYCFNKLSKEFQDDNARAFYIQMYENIKGKKLISSRIINSQYSTTYAVKETTIYSLAYEYEYEYPNSLWVYYTFQILKKDNDFEVQTFNINPSDHSLSLDYEFTFKNKSFRHFLWLFFSIIIPLFILTTIVFIIKTPIKKKWLWIIFILIGFVSFSLNWTTGEFGISPISFKLLGAGFIKSGIIAPWIISFSIPFGAIFFWIKRRQILTENKQKEDNVTQQI